jgi:hypothetical protein
MSATARKKIAGGDAQRAHAFLEMFSFVLEAMRLKATTHTKPMDKPAKTDRAGSQNPETKLDSLDARTPRIITIAVNPMNIGPGAKPGT